MAKERTLKNLYRDPNNAVIGGVCAGIAERLDVDALLVRVAAIAAAIMTFGLAIVLYLVLFMILPIKPTNDTFVELEPIRVQSERYGRVISVRKDRSKPRKSEVKVYEHDTIGSSFREHHASDLGAYRLAMALLGLSFLIETLIIIAAMYVVEGSTFASFLPAYFISAGIFFLAFPSSRWKPSIRVCAFILCCEACFIFMPFTLGLSNYESVEHIHSYTFLLWIASLVVLLAAIVFENTWCYIWAIALILLSSIISFYDFGIFTLPSYVTFENFKSFIALGLLV